MGTRFIILTIIITILCRVDSETIQKNEGIPIVDSSIALPQIRSPYLFSTKQMNLEAIGNNLNPQLLTKQKQNEKNPIVTKQIQQSINNQSSKYKNQQTNNSQVSNQQKRISIDNGSKNLTQNNSKESLLTKNQKVKLEKTQFQKIDLKKLMQVIEKEQKTKKIVKSNQPEITYQALFGPIKNEQNDNKNKSTQKVIQKVSIISSQKSNQNQFKNISYDKQQMQFKQAERNQKQLDFQSDIPNLNQKQVSPPLVEKYKVKNSQKSNKQQDDNVKKTKNNRDASILIEKQDYKQKYRKIQLQMQQLKDKLKLEEQKPSLNEHHSTKKESDQTQYTLCINVKTIVILAVIVLLLAVYFMSKKGKSSRIEDRYSLGDDQKIPSEDTD